jgi:DNA polymerase-3 subunit alpha
VIIGLDDATGRMDVVVFGEIFEAYKGPLASGDMLVIEGEIAHDDYNGGVKMTAKLLYSVADARIKFARCLELRLHQDKHNLVPALQALLKAHSGPCVVQLAYSNDHAKANLNLDKQWHVTPNDDLLGLLEGLLGPDQVVMHY